MRQKLNQIMILNGLYFITASFFDLISSSFNLLFALIFPIFLFLIISFTIFKELSLVANLTKKVPNIVLLLNVLGAYTIVYFIVNLLGTILQYMNEQGLLTSIYSIYEEWGEAIGAAVELLFFGIFIFAVFIILIRILKKIIIVKIVGKKS